MFNPPKTMLQEVHLRISAEVWTALREYKEFAGESSLSQAARKLLRERLVELGFLNEKIREKIADVRPSRIPPRDF
jgi:DNA-directed RNA polymerase subunit F